MTVFECLHMPSLDRATEWLNSEPLGSHDIDTLASDAAALRGSFELYRAFPTIAQNELAVLTAFLAPGRDGENRELARAQKTASTASAMVIEDTSIRPEGDPDV